MPGWVRSDVEAMPESCAALLEHVRHNDEVQTHVFFGSDLVPFVVAAWTAGDAEQLRSSSGPVLRKGRL